MLPSPGRYENYHTTAVQHGPRRETRADIYGVESELLMVGTAARRIPCFPGKSLPSVERRANSQGRSGTTYPSGVRLVLPSIDRYKNFPGRAEFHTHCEENKHVRGLCKTNYSSLGTRKKNSGSGGARHRYYPPHLAFQTGPPSESCQQSNLESRPSRIRHCHVKQP